MAFLSWFCTEVAFDKVLLILMTMTLPVVMATEMMLLCLSGTVVLDVGKKRDDGEIRDGERPWRSLTSNFKDQESCILINSVGRIIMPYFQTDIGVKMNRLKGRDFPPAVQASSDHY